jgi:hypothetical protein
MQILHPFAGSLQQYTERLADPDCYRPGHCPQCQPNSPSPRTASTRAHSSTQPSTASFACAATCATPAGAPSLYCPSSSCPTCVSSLMVIALFLVARLLRGQTIEAAARAAPPPMPYQRGQFWIRRFRAQAEALCAALAALTPTHSRARLRPPRSDHAPIHRLDRRSSLPVCRRALPPAGLAARSGSRRPPRRILLRRSARLSLPTHHLHGTAKPSSVSSGPGEKTTLWTKKPKRSRSSGTASSRPWCWRRCPAANSRAAPNRSPPASTTFPHSTRRQVSVDTLLDWTLRYRRNGLPALSPKPRQDRGQARAVAHGNRRSH